jgi:hypothetical protein
MDISVRAHITEAASLLEAVHRRHIPFATVLAATSTAQDVKAREQSVMQQVFDRPTMYTMNALKVRPATRANPVASVEFKEFGGTPAKRFLNPNIHGGGRALKSTERQLGAQYYVPGLDMKKDGYGNLPGSVYRRILSHLKASTNVDANISGSARSRRKRRGNVFFKTKKGYVLQRLGKHDLKVALVPIRAPQYQKRFPFYETAHAVVAERYPPNFVAALQRAINTSNTRGPWGGVGG